MLACLVTFLGAAMSQDDPDGGFGDISAFLPLNQPQSNVRIPSLTPEGAIKTLIEAETVTRIDDGNLRLKNMIITVFNKSGEPHLRVLTTSAIFNVETNILSSDKRTRSIHTDFVQEGDGMTFNTETRVGKMTGNVVTHVLKADDLGIVIPGDAPAKKETSN